MKTKKIGAKSGNKIAHNKVLECGALGLIVMATMIGTVATSKTAKAEESATSTASVTVSSACTMSATVNTPHTAEVVASTYQANIGKTTISTICNDINGYSIYAIGYTNTEWGRNDMLGGSTGRTITTGTATSGDTSNWAMKLTAVQGDYTPSITTGYDAYHTVPDEYVKVASYNNTTGDSANPSQLETTYAMFATSNQVPDTYTGKVKYTLVHSASSTEKPCTGTYTINYNANGGSGNMDSQTVCADVQVGLLPNGYTPPTPVADKQFALWNTAADGSGYNYYPGQSVANLASVDESITLYAQWGPKYMQDLSTNVCRAIATEAAYTVYDRRDGSDYKVRYLAGACWMTQNLRLKGVINEQFSNFSSHSNVDVCEGDLTTGNSTDEPRCHDSGNTTNGVWYNYAAASAKTIVGSSNFTEATEDICPAGWKMPSNTGDTGSVASIVALPSVDVPAFQPVAGGYYNSGSINYTGLGYWWSTTANDTNLRYYLYWSGSSLSSSSNNRYYGYYIRCVRS